ncbi:MAG: serine protease [Acidobacteriota bacterium]
MSRHFLLALLIVFVAMPAIAADPVRLDAKLLGVEVIERVVLPRVDEEVAKRQDFEATEAGQTARYAVPHAVRITPSSHGTWEQRDDGSWVWRLRLISRDAYSLNLGFSRYRMPKGGTLRIYATTGRGQVVGPFTARDNETHGELWTPPLPTDDLIVELTLPANKLRRYDLELSWINHGYAGFGEPQPRSGACNVDVTCPPAADWRNEARAVALVSVAGRHFCTGFLLNNTAEDGRPLFLTAKHCGIDETNAASVVVFWGHQSRVCRRGASSYQAGDLRRFQTGARWLAGHDDTDFALLELDDIPKARHRVYYAGWDRRHRAVAEATVIHHPNTDAKRIAYSSVGAVPTSHLGDDVPGDGSHLRVASWDLGTTEGGSSGAPLFDEHHRVIGQLHGGWAACGADEPDWFGRLSAAWDGPTPDTRLRDWLDPMATGTPVLDGIDSAGE